LVAQRGRSASDLGQERVAAGAARGFPLAVDLKLQVRMIFVAMQEAEKITPKPGYMGFVGGGYAVNCKKKLGRPLLRCAEPIFHMNPQKSGCYVGLADMRYLLEMLLHTFYNHWFSLRYVLQYIVHFTCNNFIY
jgi:hypothetical protein